jgi:hypothetical protein
MTPIAVERGNQRDDRRANSQTPLMPKHSPGD